MTRLTTSTNLLLLMAFAVKMSDSMGIGGGTIVQRNNFIQPPSTFISHGGFSGGGGGGVSNPIKSSDINPPMPITNRLNGGTLPSHFRYALESGARKERGITKSQNEPTRWHWLHQMNKDYGTNEEQDIDEPAPTTAKLLDKAEEDGEDTPAKRLLRNILARIKLMDRMKMAGLREERTRASQYYSGRYGPRPRPPLLILG